MLNEKVRAVDTLIGNVKTVLTGTYHAIKSAKYGHRYRAEVPFRFNRRYDMLDSLPRALAATPKQPERAIRVAEVHR